MDSGFTWTLPAAALAFLLVRAAVHRLRLSRAKHPSLRGHSRIARRLARHLPFYEYGEDRFFDSDGAPGEVAALRRQSLAQLSALFRERSPRSLAMSRELEAGIADLGFINNYRVPFQYRGLVRRQLPLGTVVEETRGVQVRDLDGNWAYDLSGAYGVNLFGYDFYKDCIECGAERVRALGPVLGPYHPLVADNVARLRALSGKEQVSFHMSGTEAVMQAVALARFQTGRSHLVRFCGAYHGWWDGVQPGPGNPRDTRDVYTLKDMHPATLAVLRTRKDIACVLVNPLQALHPNASAPGDAALLDGGRRAGFDKERYAAWLRDLREVCSARGIVLLFDEVFLGFRLARGGAQEYFGVPADLVTYGKTLGGGLPVGVVCGDASLMRRHRPERPAHICFARGTFNSHPYVMGAMNEFLRRLDEPSWRLDYPLLDRLWGERVQRLNTRLGQLALPLRVAALSSVWTVLYTAPGRYHWMFQYYLRAEGLALSWVGSGRFIFPHGLGDEDYQAIEERFVAAARAMQEGGWWWRDETLTDKAIRRRVTRELLRVWLHEPQPARRGGDEAKAPAATATR